MGPPPPVFTGAGSRREDNGGERDGRFANSPYQMVVRRVVGMGPASAGTTEGAGRAVREQAPTRWLSDGWEGWVPASARTTGGRGSGRFANKPLPDGCQTGRRDGSPHQRGQRGGRGSGRFANSPTRWLSDGWEERVIMFGPSSAFLKYVSGLLPGWESERVRQTTVAKWMLGQFSSRVTRSTGDKLFLDLMNNRRKLTEKRLRPYFKTGLGMRRLLDNYASSLLRRVKAKVAAQGDIEFTSILPGA